jgi:hypothetical protein
LHALDKKCELYKISYWRIYAFVSSSLFYRRVNIEEDTYNGIVIPKARICCFQFMKFIVIQTFGNSQMNLFRTFLDENIKFSKNYFPLVRDLECVLAIILPCMKWF